MRLRTPTLCRWPTTPTSMFRSPTTLATSRTPSISSGRIKNNGSKSICALKSYTSALLLITFGGGDGYGYGFCFL